MALSNFPKGAEMPHSNLRLLKHTQSLHVQPSLRINAFTRPSAQVLDRFLLGIEIENLLSFPVILNQLSAVSSKWKIGSVEDEQTTTLIPEIQPQQTVYIYYRFSQAAGADRVLDLTPEKIVSQAIERIVMTDNEIVSIDPAPLNMTVSSLLLVVSANILTICRVLKCIDVREFL